MGAPAGGGLGAFGAAATAAAPPPPQAPTLPAALVGLVKAVDPASATCTLRTALYNVVPDGTPGRHVRPPDFEPRLWADAVARNPDPASLVPVQAVLFDDLSARTGLQADRLGGHAAVLGELDDRLAGIAAELDGDIAARLAAARRRHRALSSRAVAVAGRVATARGGRSPLTAAEVGLAQTLQGLVSTLQGATGREAVADLADEARAVAEQRSREGGGGMGGGGGGRGGGGGGGRGGGAGGLDPAGVARVKAVLVEQLSAIEKLVEEQRVLGRDVGLVVDGLAAAGAGGG